MCVNMLHINMSSNVSLYILFICLLDFWFSGLHVHHLVHWEWHLGIHRGEFLHYLPPQGWWGECISLSISHLLVLRHHPQHRGSHLSLCQVRCWNNVEIVWLYRFISSVCSKWCHYLLAVLFQTCMTFFLLLEQRRYLEKILIMVNTGNQWQPKLFVYRHSQHLILNNVIEIFIPNIPKSFKLFCWYNHL